MGCTLSRIMEGGSKSQALRADKRSVHSSHRRRGKIMKILITGGEQSGKSTLAKYMKMSLAGGLLHEEIEAMRRHLHANILEIMKIIVKAMRKLEIDFSDPELADRSTKLRECFVGPSGILDLETMDLIEDLWNDNGVKECYRIVCHGQDNSGGRHVIDGAGHVLSNISRYRVDGFEVTDRDILNVHQKHSDAYEICFSFWKYDYTAYDFSNAQPLTDMVFSKFVNVELVIFCASLADYDIMDGEKDADGQSNRLLKSLGMFKRLCKSSFIRDTFVWLILNKKDVFRAKLAKTPLDVCFPDYQGKKGDAPSACNFIKDQFRAIHPRHNELLVYIMCATDETGQSKFKKAYEKACESRSLLEYGLLK